MARRDDRAGHADLFRRALAENITLAEAARRQAEHDNAARLADAKARHGEAMRRLYAKGFGRQHRMPIR